MMRAARATWPSAALDARLDPFEATAVLARLAAPLDQVAEQAAAAARRVPVEGLGALPAASAPLLDITAEQHAAWPVRLFAS